MHSLVPTYLESLRFSAGQATVLRTIGEYRGKQQLFVGQSPQTLTDLRQVAVIESTESSNRLEGVVVEPKRLKSLVLRAAHHPVRLPAAAGRHLEGDEQRHIVEIVERHPAGTSRVRFRPVQAHLTPMAMAELVRTTG